MSLNTTPSVTWLMCTHRQDDFLHRAIQSCLQQTLSNFELLIVVNGIDATGIATALLERYAKDSRVRVVSTSLHLLNFSLSLGLHLARAPFVARMDADDVAVAERLAMQLAFMQSHPDVVVLGSAYQLIDEQENWCGKVDLPESDQQIRRSLFFRNPICHPSVMLRKAVVCQEGGYLGGQNAEDYDLWVRLAVNSEYKFANLATPLVKYRIDAKGLARRSRTAYANVAAAQMRNFIMTRRVRWLLGCCVMALKAFVYAIRA